MDPTTEPPPKVEEWTPEQVHHWLCETNKVDQKYADKLFEEEVSGEELVCFKVKDLYDLGIKHGPAVKIIKRLEALNKIELHLHTKTENTNLAAHSHKTGEKSSKAVSAETAASEQGQLERTRTFRKDDKSNTIKPQFPKSRKTQKDEIPDTDPHQIKDTEKLVIPHQKKTVNYHEELEMPTEELSKALPSTGNDSNILGNEKECQKPLRLCSFFPFDKVSEPHRYIEGYMLPPETGSHSLIDPVHEYKSMECRGDINIMKKVFSEKVFKFAAGCLNSRTNGTIHCGVRDSKENPKKYFHGQIVGVNVDKKYTIIDHFNTSCKKYFEDSAEEAKMCIRQPRFVEVLSPDNTSSNKYVIEVDIVPNISIVHGKTFLIQTFDEKNNWKRTEGKSLFIRDGASTRNIYMNTNDSNKFTKNMNSLDMMREQAEKKPDKNRTSDQGERVRSLLTHGGKTLDYDYCIVVTNKSHPEQLQHLQFLSTLKLFCVLDFDPTSAVCGSCHTYRESSIANLHKPEQFQGDSKTFIKNLNLYTQTSWVFCNGREDLTEECNRPQDPSEGLTVVDRAGGVTDVISFLCNDETLPSGRFLILFLILSTVEAMTDPIFETFMMFYQRVGKSEQILSLCTSETAFKNWTDFTKARCAIDMANESIFHLELREVNGTVLNLEQHDKAKPRFLPCAGGSSVILERIDEDNMNTLSILCQNECENVYDENSEEFQNFRLNTEEQFYRGDKVKWWNFYFSDKEIARSIIKRDKYANLKKMIHSQTNDPTSTCVIVNLFHYPGCGGTTLAMHVMWSLRNEFRCAVLQDNNTAKTEVAQQVAHLMRCGKSENTLKTPVLLLVEDSEKNTQELRNCIRRATAGLSSDALVIILNCLRSRNPKLRYEQSVIGSQYIANQLSKEERDLFEMKRNELRGIHEKPENFYKFMIMKSNSSQTYVQDVVCHILKNFDIESKPAQLLSILALLNCYVADSAISVSLCEQFMGINRILCWGREKVLEKMEPYSFLLIEFPVQEYGVYKAIRFVHQSFAREFVRELEESHNCPRFNTAIGLLHCDLLFKTGMGIDTLMQSVKSMLITRQRRTQGDEKDTLFSPFIEDICSSDNGLKNVADILTIASGRFDKDFVIPQALARHFYLHEKNFEKAMIWAEKAKNIKENFYTLDTVGQVSRNELKHKYDPNKEENEAFTPEKLKECFHIAISATKAFQRAQTLEKSAISDFMDGHKGRSSTYNLSAYMGEIDIAITVFDIVTNLPLFKDKDSMKKHYIGQFFNGNMPISSIPIVQNEANKQLAVILEEYEHFLGSLKSQVNKAFDFLEIYFTYLRGKGHAEVKETQNRKIMSEYFKKYISLFSSNQDKHKKQNPTLSLDMQIEECRMFLEENRANTFARILQHVEDRGDMILDIASKHSFIYQNSTTTKNDKINHLLAHIILAVVQPKSKAKSNKELTDLLQEILQDVGTGHPHPEPYYLATLLLWPGGKEINKHIVTYIYAMRDSSRKQLSHLYRTRHTIAHFLLGRSEGLQRLIPKATLDRQAGRRHNVLWQSGEIFKEQLIKDQLFRINGIMTQGEIFAEYNKLRIPVCPAFPGLCSGHSTKRVSFYIGFAIDGPLAYDIQQEN